MLEREPTKEREQELVRSDTTLSRVQHTDVVPLITTRGDLGRVQSGKGGDLDIWQLWELSLYERTLSEPG